MTREQAIQEVRSRWRDYLEPAKKAGTYICRIGDCNNGTGKDGDGMTAIPGSRDGNAFHCFKCDFSGDLIDYYQAMTGCTFTEALEALCKHFNIVMDDDTTYSHKKPHKGSQTVQETDYSSGKPEGSEKSVQEEKIPEEKPKQKNLSDYYKECQARFEGSAGQQYINGRGIRTETAIRYGLGYDPSFIHPVTAEEAKGKDWTPTPTPRLIVPITNFSCLARDVRSNLTKDEDRYKKMKVGNVNTFNADDLYNKAGKPVFLVEGEIDALSVIEMGYPAVGLGNAAGWKRIIDRLKGKPTPNVLIICPDHDKESKTGDKETAKFTAALDEIKAKYIVADISGDMKDANDALVEDRQGFADRLKKAEARAKQPDNMDSYIDEFFLKDVDEFCKAKQIMTGFGELDKKSGGIYPGLYAVGAISSLGKTTLIHQIADHIAATGNHVLFFSLEQSRFELVSKSFSRLTAKDNFDTAVSSIRIREGQIDNSVKQAIGKYRKTIADRMNIIEGNFGTDTNFIRDYVETYIQQNNIKPVVIVDYLQILEPAAEDKRQSTKEQTDSNVTELKRLSRDQKIPVIVISSVNRANYLTPIDFESFKESGGIEYTADVVWGLQLKVLDTEEVFDKPNRIKEKREKIQIAKAAIPREVQLVCLKNRYGISSFKTGFMYYPQFDLFLSEENQYDSDDPKSEPDLDF